MSQFAQEVKYAPAGSNPEPIVQRLEHLPKPVNIRLAPANIVMLVQRIIDINLGRPILLFLVEENMCVEVYGTHEELAGGGRFETLRAD